MKEGGLLAVVLVLECWEEMSENRAVTTVEDVD